MSEPAGPADHDTQVERLEHEVSMIVRRSRSVLRALAGHVHPDVDAAAYAVLLAIGRSAPLRLMDLAEEFGLDKSTMSRQVSALSRLGLVQRTPDPIDGRAFLLELSPEGRQRLGEVTSARHEVWRSRLASWSTEEIRALADGMNRLSASLPVPQVTSDDAEPPTVA